MRIDPRDPAELDDTRRALHERMAPVVQEHLKGFVSSRSDGALVGPFTAMVEFPTWGAPAWDFTASLIEHSSLPKGPHEVAILVVGAQFRSRYELYAHEAVAAAAGLTQHTISTISAGQRPADLTEQEGVAYDVAAVLSRGGQLPQSTYRAALDAFGAEGTAELVYLVGAYCLVSVVLNAYDVAVPERDENAG